MTLYLNDMGVISPLGAGKAQVLANLLAGSTAGMEPYDGLFTGRATTVGRVRADLDELPDDFAELDCRNNRLLKHALDEVRASVDELRETVGPHRVAVVLGTSTSHPASHPAGFVAGVCTNLRTLPPSRSMKARIRPAVIAKRFSFAVVPGTAAVSQQLSRLTVPPPSSVSLRPHVNPPPFSTQLLNGTQRFAFGPLFAHAPDAQSS